MSRGTLDPEQIAALVEAAKSGNLPDAAAPLQARRQDVRKVDFTRPRKFGPDVVHQLRRAVDEFAAAAALRLSAELRAAIEIEIIAARQRTWIDAHTLTPEASLSTVLELDPGASMLLALEDSLLVGVIELLTGGASPAQAPPRRLTDIDRAVGAIFIRTLAGILGEVWNRQVGQQVTVGRSDLHAEFAQLVGLSDATYVMTLELVMGGSSSTFDLLIPWAAIAAVASGPDRDAVRAHPLRGLLSQVHVEALAEVAAVELPIERVLALRPGDVVSLGRPAAAGVTLLGGTIPVHVAHPGSSGPHRAVQIVGPAPAGEGTAP